MVQKLNVRVYRFVMKDTIEERMLKTQKAKQALGKGTMTKLSREEEEMAKVTSLRDLFQINSSPLSTSLLSSSLSNTKHNVVVGDWS